MDSPGSNVAIRPQISLREMGEVKAAGYVTVVNHRPDGEEPGQPTSESLAAEAGRLGLDYVWIPVSGFPDDAAVEATAAVLRRSSADRPVLMFCRSGMRSTVAWARAMCADGADPDAVRAAAAAAGYDLSRVPL
ncbi:TIGR01244 family sulfur transferase [Brevundimonas sp. FT23028]|uniref:TIGR01244 family sulfur transferase n=1 Tax=Brevundimonas sp. FT23028 TaxID=3393748 RepID=UPI003B5873A6